METVFSIEKLISIVNKKKDGHFKYKYFGSFNKLIAHYRLGVISLSPNHSSIKYTLD